jgi:hypothetical protein
MKVKQVREQMLVGLRQGNCNAQHSTTYSPKMGDETRVEIFLVNATDGSCFLVTITDLSEEKK